MSTRTLLNVDYYRNLLADDPSAFLNAVHENCFVTVLCEENQVLINEIKKRRDAVDDEEYRALLTAKLYLAVERAELVTDEMRRRFPSLEVPTAEEQERLSRRFNQLGPISTSQQISNVCLLMKNHARLIALVEETSNLNADWNMINPNRLS